MRQPAKNGPQAPQRDSRNQQQAPWYQIGNAPKGKPYKGIKDRKSGPLQQADSKIGDVKIGANGIDQQGKNLQVGVGKHRRQREHCNGPPALHGGGALPDGDAGG